MSHHQEPKVTLAEVRKHVAEGELIVLVAAASASPGRRR
jgi:hypothetical protein